MNEVSKHNGLRTKIERSNARKREVTSTLALGWKEDIITQAFQNKNVVK